MRLDNFDECQIKLPESQLEQELRYQIEYFKSKIVTIDVTH